MAKAKIFCEVTCILCGTCASDLYKNATTIAALKETTKDWVWNNSVNGNVCPGCQEELKSKSKEPEIDTSVFDAWEATK